MGRLYMNQAGIEELKAQRNNALDMLANANAAHASWHVTCQAIDLDDDDQRLQNWCAENLPTLSSIGLWMENKIATPSWTHVQIVPPHSGQRVYFPNAAWARRALEQGLA